MRRHITRIACVLGVSLLIAGSLAATATAAPLTTPDSALQTPNVRQIPATGTVRIPAIVIDFSDAPCTMGLSDLTSTLFGEGKSEKAPMESLSAFYRRSSYGALTLTGDVLGVYHVASTRAQAEGLGQTALIEDALASFDASGTEFARYDGDGDGRIDYLIVMWTGSAHRGSPWWGSFTVGGSGERFDGTVLGAYAWVPVPGDFSARTLVHETGHALGLADLYDGNRELGPGGGVGAFDPMGDGSCDHNALSKIMLGWIKPRIIGTGIEKLNLQPTSVAPDAVIVMPGFSLEAPYREFYVVQARARSGNDAAWPYASTAALQVWHVDATLGEGGRYAYNNSTTAHKFLRLVEADGKREIEKLDMSNSTDLFRTGATFSAASAPSSDLYTGDRSGVTVSSIRTAAGSVSFSADARASACTDRLADARVARKISRAAGQRLDARRLRATRTPQEPRPE